MSSRPVLRQRTKSCGGIKIRPSVPLRQQAPQVRQSSSSGIGGEYGSGGVGRTWWTLAGGRDLVRGMWRALVCATVLLYGCTRNEPKQEVELPKVAPETLVVLWTVLSRSSDRDSIQVALDGSRKLNVMRRTPGGTRMSIDRTVSEVEYAKLVGTLRALDCCSLQSTSKESARPTEAKPRLEIDLGDVQCDIELWDREWREGRARECGFAVAQFHGSGFVPYPPVDEASP